MIWLHDGWFCLNMFWVENVWLISKKKIECKHQCSQKQSKKVDSVQCQSVPMAHTIWLSWISWILLRLMGVAKLWVETRQRSWRSLLEIKFRMRLLTPPQTFAKTLINFSSNQMFIGKWQMLPLKHAIVNMNCFDWEAAVKTLSSWIATTIGKQQMPAPTWPIDVEANKFRIRNALTS